MQKFSVGVRGVKIVPKKESSNILCANVCDGKNAWN